MYIFIYLNKTHKSKSSCIYIYIHIIKKVYLCAHMSNYACVYIYMRVFIYQTCVLVRNKYELPIMF